MPSSLRAFGLEEMLRCGRGLRDLARAAPTVESAAERLTRYLYEELRDPHAPGGNECAMVRFYKTHAYGDLPRELQEYAARRMHGARPDPSMRCLVLLGTAGDEPEWNDRRASAGHRAIPLPSEEIVEQAPMIAGLIRALGMEISTVVGAEGIALAGALGKTYNVFHVKEAEGSPFIPAQDFVREHGIRSVIGFGGFLFNGDLYAVILFTKVPVARETADRFRNLALDIRIAISTLASGQVFTPAASR